VSLLPGFIRLSQGLYFKASTKSTEELKANLSYSRGVGYIMVSCGGRYRRADERRAAHR